MISVSPISDARRAAYGLPDRLTHAASAASKQLAGLSDALSGRVANLVVLDDVGAGGAADVYAALCERYSRIPVLKAHVTEPPSFIRDNSVVVLFADEVEEEMLKEAAREVHERRARLILIASSSSASLLNMYSDRCTVCVVDPVAPWDTPGLVELLAYGLTLLGAIGGMPDAVTLLTSAADELRPELPTLDDDGGVADVLAQQLSDGVPVVVGNGVLGEAAARLWKACLNIETGRLAFSSSLYDARLLAPTLIEPPIVASPETAQSVDKRFLFILLYHGDDDPRALEALGELTHFLDQRDIPHVQVEPRTVDILARFFESVVLGQLVSLRRSELAGTVQETTVYRV